MKIQLYENTFDTCEGIIHVEMPKGEHSYSIKAPLL